MCILNRSFIRTSVILRLVRHVARGDSMVHEYNLLSALNEQHERRVATRCQLPLHITSEITQLDLFCDNQVIHKFLSLKSKKTTFTQITSEIALVLFCDLIM